MTVANNIKQNNLITQFSELLAFKVSPEVFCEEDTLGSTEAPSSKYRYFIIHIVETIKKEKNNTYYYEYKENQYRILYYPFE